jgi:hypothetical protein
VRTTACSQRVRRGRHCSKLERNYRKENHKCNVSARLSRPAPAPRRAAVATTHALDMRYYTTLASRRVHCGDTCCSSVRQHHLNQLFLLPFTLARPSPGTRQAPSTQHPRSARGTAPGSRRGGRAHQIMWAVRRMSRRGVRPLVAGTWGVALGAARAHDCPWD